MTSNPKKPIRKTYKAIFKQETSAWKNIWKKDKTYNTSAKWLWDLKADHSNPSEQELVINTVSEIKQWAKNMNS